MPTLREFILGSMSKGIEQGSAAGREGVGRQYADDRIAALKADNKGARVSVGPSGAQTIDPQDDLINNLRREQLKELQNERSERAVTKLSDSIERSGLTRMQPAIASIQKSFKGESVSPTILALPESVRGVAIAGKAALGRSAKEAQEANKKSITSRLASFLGVGPEAAEADQEYQDLQRLMNIDIKQFSGTAVTRYEEGRNMIAQGQRAGGNPELVRRGVEMMREAALSQAKNIKAGTRPEAIKAYEARLGAPIEGSLAEPTPTISSKMTRLEELRRKARGQ